MDSIFFLDSEARRCFLHATGRALGCLYICLWSYIPLLSNCLVCMDAWFHEDDASQPSSSTLSVPQRLFDAYKRSPCTIQDRCVPGLAFKQGSPYFEVSGSELISSASLQVQQQLYQEAGVKVKEKEEAKEWSDFQLLQEGVSAFMEELANFTLQTEVEFEAVGAAISNMEASLHKLGNHIGEPLEMNSYEQEVDKYFGVDKDEEVEKARPETLKEILYLEADLHIKHRGYISGITIEARRMIQYEDLPKPRLNNS